MCREYMNIYPLCGCLHLIGTKPCRRIETTTDACPDLDRTTRYKYRIRCPSCRSEIQEKARKGRAKNTAEPVLEMEKTLREKISLLALKHEEDPKPTAPEYDIPDDSSEEWEDEHCPMKERASERWIFSEAGRSHIRKLDLINRYGQDVIYIPPPVRGSKWDIRRFDNVDFGKTDSQLQMSFSLKERTDSVATFEGDKNRLYEASPFAVASISTRSPGPETEVTSVEDAESSDGVHENTDLDEEKREPPEPVYRSSKTKHRADGKPQKGGVFKKMFGNFSHKQSLEMR